MKSKNVTKRLNTAPALEQLIADSTEVFRNLTSSWPISSPYSPSSTILGSVTQLINRGKHNVMKIDALIAYRPMTEAGGRMNKVHYHLDAPGFFQLHLWPSIVEHRVGVSLLP